MNQVSSINQRQKILYIGTRFEGINIEEERKKIQDIMDADGSKFYVDPRIVGSTDEVASIIQRAGNSQIIHISGHGTGEGKINIIDQEYPTKGEVLKPETLAKYIQNAGDVDCVLLNFCYSKEAAEFIAKNVQNVKCVIGINGDIESTPAVQFSTAFYQELCGKPLDSSLVDEAFLKGRAAASQRTGNIDTYIKLPLPKPEAEMQLIEPTEGSNIPRDCKFSGTFSNLSEDASMWAYVNATLERKFYLVPIEDYHSSGTWQKEVVVGTENDTNNYRVGVLIADAEVTKTLNEDFSKSGFLRLDNLPNGSKRFGDRAVTRQ